MVIADLMRQGHDIAIAFGHNQSYDLIVIRKEDGRLENVHLKYTTSDGNVVIARIGNAARLGSAQVHDRGGGLDRELTVDDEPSLLQPLEIWRDRCRVNLRLTSPANGQTRRIPYAEDFTEL
jgi:hypothetical protein